MVPYSFAPTSHFILTFSISFTVVIGATVLGFYIHDLKFFSLFVPSGCPLGLLPLLVLIEFISTLNKLFCDKKCIMFKHRKVKSFLSICIKQR